MVDTYVFIYSYIYWDLVQWLRRLNNFIIFTTIHYATFTPPMMLFWNNIHRHCQIVHYCHKHCVAAQCRSTMGHSTLCYSIVTAHVNKQFTRVALFFILIRYFFTLLPFERHKGGVIMSRITLSKQRIIIIMPKILIGSDKLKLNAKLIRN